MLGKELATANSLWMIYIQIEGRFSIGNVSKSASTCYNTLFESRYTFNNQPVYYFRLQRGVVHESTKENNAFGFVVFIMFEFRKQYSVLTGNYFTFIKNDSSSSKIFLWKREILINLVIYTFPIASLTYK